MRRLVLFGSVSRELEFSTKKMGRQKGTLGETKQKSKAKNLIKKWKRKEKMEEEKKGENDKNFCGWKYRQKAHQGLGGSLHMAFLVIGYRVTVSLFVLRKK